MTKKAAKPKSTAVQSITVDKALWRKALKEAGGDATRIQAVDSKTVIVWNSSGQKRRMQAK